MNALKKLSSVFDTITLWLMGLSLVVMTYCLVMLIFGRNLFGVSFEKLEEISRFMLVWVTFLGSAVAFKRDEHMAFDFLLVRTPSGVQHVARICKEFLLLALVLVMFGYGIELVYANIGQTSIQAMLPISYIYMVFPLAGLAMTVHSVYRIAGIFLGREEVFDEKDKVRLD